MDFYAERRRFGRILVSLNVQYYASFPGSEELFQGYGTLKDFSLSGLYFFADPPITLRPGQILTLTISASLPNLDLLGTSHIRARGEVVRLEKSAPNHYSLGIAIKFLEGPTFFNPTESTC